ncbi:MAG: hypothetical protein OHK0039_46400 [Bacteroidia bacterium]
MHMFDFGLALRLLLRTFSLRRDSLRYPTRRRVFMVLLLPLFALTTIVNWVFLGLDEVLFARYRRQALPRVVFITGVPRTATTYLYHLLAADTAQFTCFRLWELILAPSICQKYFFRVLGWVDRRLGSPLHHLADGLDKYIFGAFRGIHDIGLRKPEEDEALLLLIFSSVYLSYFFPDTAALDPLLHFDRALPQRQQDHILQFYRRCVQRHCYVHDPQGQRFFLSKNPTFACKLGALARHFPQGRVLYLLRSPLRTIPATISLNAHIYAGFTRLHEPYPLAARTKDLVIAWYQMAHEALQGPWAYRHRVLSFEAVSQTPHHTVADVYAWLGLQPDEATRQRLIGAAAAARAYQSPHRYDTGIAVDVAELAAKLPFLFEK